MPRPETATLAAFRAAEEPFLPQEAPTGRLQPGATDGPRQVRKIVRTPKWVWAVSILFSFCLLQLRPVVSPTGRDISIGVPQAAAQVPTEIADLGRDLQQKSGPELIALMRMTALHWDLVDPATIEAMLEDVRDRPRLEPNAKVYAEVLLAEARSRRGDPDAGAARVAALGFIDRWLFVGPFDDQNRVGLNTPFQPEAELLAPVVGGRAFDGKERAVRFREVPAEHRGIVLDLGDFLRPRDEICAYAVTTVRSNDPAIKRASLWFGVEGAYKAWWNGAPLIEDAAYRGFDFDRSAVVVDLAAENRLTVKICGDRNAPRLAVRLADERGAPSRSLVAQADFASLQQPATKVDRGKGRVSLEGPLQAFERLTQGKGAKPEHLEAYARYLVMTGGNPRGAHIARDLAARAADAAPSPRRLMLAADLAEDRNRARDLVARGQKLAATATPREKTMLALAQARLARQSPNWRDAIPFYEEALALDPDNVLGILGKTELYVQAGLPFTAEHELARATSRLPRSVVLLRAHATQLRALGRDADAEALDARRFALRADDSAFVASQLERSVSRQEVAAAGRWMSILRRVEPDRVFAEMLIARSQRSLGEPAKARHALVTALELAPEDDGALRALSDLAGERGDRDEQLRHLRKIIALYPQAKDVRQYVEFLEPPKPRKDEALAWSRERLLEQAKRPPGKERTRVLRKLVATTVFPNGLASRFYQVAYQPLSDEAAAEARQFLTHYEGSKQAIEIRGARVYRADGTTAEAIESGEGAVNNPAMAMYTSTRAFAVTFPRVNAGDVVDIRYRIDDVAPKNEVADAFYDIEYLQEQSPTLSAEYVVFAPKARTLHPFVHGLPGVSAQISEDGDERVYRFVADNLRPLPAEPNMPVLGEIAGQVHVSTFTSWDELARWYYGLARDQLDVDDQVRKQVREITAGLSDEAAKVRAVYKFATELRYVALELGIEGIKPRRCALTIARGWGDCKDKATVIVTMLRELGIPANLVLVRTSQKGDMPKGAPPSIAAFDHAIAYVPSLDLFLDGTAEGTGSNSLPAMDRDAVALIVSDTGGKLTRLPNAKASASPHTRQIDVQLATDGSAQFQFSTEVAGVHAAAWRGRYQGETTRAERATLDLTTFFGTVLVDKGPGGMVVKDVDDIEKPFRVLIKGRAPTAARREGTGLSVPVASSLELLRSIASLSVRETAVVIGALTSSTEERVIRIPAGMKVVRMPEKKSISGPFGSLSIEARQDGSKVIVKSTFAIEKSRIAVADYEKFRAFCQQADDAMSQRLVVGP